MRLFPSLAAALLIAGLAGCMPPQREGGGNHPNLIIVREFAFSPGVVTLDPSLGFSLNRGVPGAPPRERAAAVGRAAAFGVADTIAQRLAGLGYDAVRSDTDAAEPGGRALIVSGSFRQIVEGHRRQNASLAIALEVSQQNGAAAPQRLAGFRLDSRTAPAPPLSEGAARRGGVNAAAERAGGAIARYVADLARLNHWPAASP